MNPFDNLPMDARQAIAVYSWVGVIVFGVLGLWELDKARRAAATPALATTPAPILSRSMEWWYCRTGHCKVLTNRAWSCPTCNTTLEPTWRMDMCDRSGLNGWGLPCAGCSNCQSITRAA